MKLLLLFEYYLYIYFYFIITSVISYDEIAPNIDPYYGTQGMLIDAGSGGSRLHIFSWEPRVFKTVPPPLTLPRDNERYTDRISPGMSDFVDNFDGLKQYFASLINFAKITLQDKQEFWYTYPFYLRATGGMRLVPYEKREAMMSFTRELFSDKTFCPFYFQFDFARVLSGEEEAVFSWASANYLFGTLLQSMPGSGAVLKPINGTFGTIDLGGASAQISFFVPSQDISEGLFKLQIGSQRHWNVYSKSFLSYGHNSARERHLQNIAISAINDGTDSDSISTHCYFSGYQEDFITTIQKTHSTHQETVTIRGPHNSHNYQFDDCYEMLVPLLKKELNIFCNVVYDNQCSMDGFYQPSLPTGKIDGHFIASATYKYAWAFLRMPQGASLTLFKERAREICSMDYSQIKKYHKYLNTTMKKDDLLPYYCFISTYVVVLLEKGFGFTDDQTIRAIDTVGGHRTGWALGSMLYEINGLPYVLEKDKNHRFFEISAGMVAGIIFGIFSMWLFNSYGHFSISSFIKAYSNGYTKISDIPTNSNNI